MDTITHEGGFTVREIGNQREREAAYRLRYDIFCSELKWVPPVSSALDTDRYDEFSAGLGLFNPDDVLVGHVRLIKSPHPYMIEDEFKCLMPAETEFKKLPDMAESTRICVDKAYRTVKVNGITLGSLLYKAIYYWCIINDARWLVTIIEQRYYRFLLRTFPFAPLGEFMLLGDGVPSGVVQLDWRAFEERTSSSHPAFFKWMTNQLIQSPERRLRHA